MAGLRQKVGKGDIAPVFRLRDLSGAERALPDLLAEGPVLLAFFKVSCPVCQMAFPYLERARDNVALRVIGISQDNSKKTSEFLRAFGVKFDTLLDEEASGYAASNAYGLTVVPAMFQVETDGRISHAWNGWVKSEMEALGKRVGNEIIRPGDQVPVLRPG